MYEHLNIDLFFMVFYALWSQQSWTGSSYCTARRMCVRLENHITKPSGGVSWPGCGYKHQISPAASHYAAAQSRQTEIEVEAKINLKCHTLRPYHKIYTIPPCVSHVVCSLPSLWCCTNRSVTACVFVLDSGSAEAQRGRCSAILPRGFNLLKLTGRCGCVWESRKSAHTVNSMKTASYCYGPWARGLLPCVDLLQEQKVTGVNKVNLFNHGLLNLVSKSTECISTG